MSAAQAADGAAAYCGWLREQIGGMLASATNPQSGVSTPAVFRPSLPEWFDGQMPAAAVTVRPAGGYSTFGKTMWPLADPRMDVVCYGTRQGEATMIATTIAVATKQLVNEIFEGTLLCSASVDAGPTPLPDAQTLWPACWLSVQLVHGELPLPTQIV